MKMAEFHFLRTKNNLTWLPKHPYLGPGRGYSQTNFFYAQGCATCHWPWNLEGGARRGSIVDCLVAFYRTRTPVDLAALTGMELEDVGEAVHGYCRDTSLRQVRPRTARGSGRPARSRQGTPVRRTSGR